MKKVTNPKKNSAPINITHKSGALVIPVGKSIKATLEQAEFLKTRYPWLEVEDIKETKSK